jgi:hypothetical protein
MGWFEKVFKGKVATKALQFTGVAKTINSQSIRVYAEDENGNALLCSGTVTVTADSAGYAKECIYIKTDAADGVIGFYHNQGTTADSDFQALDSIAAGEITLAEGSLLLGGSGGTAEALDASTDAQVLIGNGTTLVSVAVSGDVTIANDGAVTIANDAVTSAKTDEGLVKTAEIALTEANIIAMNGAPVEVVAGQAGKVTEFLGAALIYDFDTAAYTGGGNVSIIEEDGSDVSTVASAANSLGSATDELNILKPVEATYQPVAGKGLMITNATAAFADPGTAAGVARLKISYRVHTTDL